MLNETKILKMAQKNKKQTGASIIEYALVVAAVVAIGVVVFGADGKSGTIGNAISTKVTNTATAINGNGNGS